MWAYNYSDYLCHHGIKGQRWGVRRFQNEDGTLTEEGRNRYGVSSYAPEKKILSKEEQAQAIKEKRKATMKKIMGVAMGLVRVTNMAYDVKAAHDFIKDVDSGKIVEDVYNAEKKQAERWKGYDEKIRLGLEKAISEKPDGTGKRFAQQVVNNQNRQSDRYRGWDENIAPGIEKAIGRKKEEQERKKRIDEIRRNLEKG